MTSSSRSALLLALLALPLAALVPARALAQTPTPTPPTAQELETARGLYKEGKELRARGNLRGALEKLQAAHALGNTPVTGIELARTYVLVGQIVEAREVCLYVARMPVASDETEKSAEARTDAAKLAEELRPRIPTLHVTVQGLAPGETAHLSIDGVAIPDAAVGEPQKVDPGKHAVAIQVGRGGAAREVHAEAQVAEGQNADVVLTVPPVPPPEPPAPPVHPTSAGASTALVRVGFATAIVGGAVGLLSGLTAWNKKSQLESECPTDACTTSGAQQDLSTAKTWGNVSTVAFAIGGAGVVVGVIGLLTGRSDGDVHGASTGVSPWIGAGAAGLHGRF